MRIPALLVAFVLTLPAVAAQAQQPVPDAPQPQKKQQPAKPSDPPPLPAKDDNAFPEEQSKAAADTASHDKQTPPANDDNAFPEEQSKAAAAAQDKQTQPPTEGNAFPEERSKAAAKAAGNDVTQPAVPVHDPARSKKDDEVGRFYLAKGDYKGALLRYQDATATDPTNADAIFGLAQAQHNLKQNAEALKNYELFLKIVPEGPKAKQAMKALKEIETGK